MASLTLILQRPFFGFLEGIGTMEMMLVAVIGLLLFGGKGLPDMARTFGKVLREFKKASANVEDEVKRVMNEDPPLPRPTPARKPVHLSPASLPASLPAPAPEAAPGTPPTGDTTKA